MDPVDLFLEQRPFIAAIFEPDRQGPLVAGDPFSFKQIGKCDLAKQIVILGEDGVADLAKGQASLDHERDVACDRRIDGKRPINDRIRLRREQHIEIRLSNEDRLAEFERSGDFIRQPADRSDAISFEQDFSRLTGPQMRNFGRGERK